MNCSIKGYEEIENKLDQIKEEMISTNGKDNVRLNRLFGKEAALRWVMGRGII